MDQQMIVMPPGVERPAGVSPGELPCAPEELAYAAGRDQVGLWRSDARKRQQWRRDSATAIEYWDGNQFSAELARKFAARGLPMITRNVLKDWVNSITGIMEKNLSDGIVRMEDSRFEALGLAMTQRLKEAERVTKADRACLDAAEYAFKGGIGWVEVGSNSDPFDYPHRVECMNWREMDWDTSAVKPDLSDAEWFRRVKAYPRSVLMAAMPHCAEMIRTAGSETDSVAWYEPEQLERDQNTWRDPSRWSGFGLPQSLVTISEFRYRVNVDGYVIQTNGGPVIFDEKNEAHLQAYYAGQVEPQAARYRRVRQAFWIGPYCLTDRWNPRPDHEIGWVPTICYIEDQTGAPYGLIRDKISMQDEINATKGKMHWSMDSTTIIADHDRVKNMDDAREAVNRRDGVVILDGDKPSGRFELDRHSGITQWQFQVYQDAVSTFTTPVAAGRDSGQSGLSQQVQIQQTETGVAKPMAHAREARTRVLALLVNQIAARMTGPEELTYKDHGGQPKTVQINVPVQLEDGTEETLTLSEIKRQVVLDETPSTPTWRSQQYLQIVDSLRAMPPEAQKFLIPAMFEMSELPNRQVYADMAKKEFGMGEPSEEEQQDMQKQKQLADMMQELQVVLAEAKALNEKAKAGKVAAETAAIQQDMQAQELALAATGGVPQKTEGTFRW